jgi:uncharacterized protein YjeT (DUF2065 family)
MASIFWLAMGFLWVVEGVGRPHPTDAGLQF